MKTRMLFFFLLTTCGLAQGTDEYIRFAPNRNSIWFSNNGIQAWHPNAPQQPFYWGQGWEWPSGSNKFVGYYAGLLYGGFVNGRIQTGGTYWRTGLRGGGILDSLVAADAAHPTSKIWHIKRGDEISGTNPDYLNWPSAHGAPADSLGKPLLLGDEQLWFVSNDLDTNYVKNLYGSDPLGFEIQTSVWGFNTDFLRDAVFVRQLLINKGPYNMKDAYLGLFLDFDLGDADDDFAGVDTVMQLSFRFNGEERDRVYPLPPAVAGVYLQTPFTASPTDTVIALGRQRPGYRYTPVTGYLFFPNGGADPMFPDPYLGSYRGSQELYNLFQGKHISGMVYTDPTSGNEARIAFAGDPIREKGWVDGIYHAPGDRFSLCSVGSFQLVKADTQEVVYAYVVQQGRDRIHSLDKLKEYAGIIRTFYQHQKYLHTTPTSDVRISYPELGKFTLHMDVIDSNAVAGKAVIVNINDSLIEEMPIFDDGLHNDGNAGDHYWSAQWTANTIRDGVDVFFDMTDPDGFTYRLHGGRRIPAAGEIWTTGYTIVSDHLNMDGKANPGENIRITLDVKNNTLFPIDGITCNRMDGTILTNDIYAISDTIQPSETKSRDYSLGGEKRFITVQIPDSGVVGSRFWVKFRIQDQRYNRWEDSVRILIEEYTNRSTDSLIAHVAGPATGTLGLRILRLNEWKDRMYRVTVKDSPTSGWLESRDLVIKDLFDKTTYQSSIPDQYAHDFPIIDGFKLTLGTADRTPTYLYNDTWENLIRPEVRYDPSQNEWTASFVPWEMGFLFFGSALGPFDSMPIRLEFSTTKQQSAYVYERGGSPNYRYAGFGTVPFRAYDISDSANPRQLNVAFVEQTGSARQNLLWDPLKPDDREYLFLLNSTYTGAEDATYTSKRILADAASMDILYAGWFYAKDSTATFTEGDQWFIIPTIPISPRDTFIVNLKGKMTSVPHLPLPRDLSLGQNYPNPFNPSTIIPYSIPRYGHVRLRVTDALSRHISTLVDDIHVAGNYEAQWDARDAVTGMYVVELEMEGTIERKLMTLVK